jgi:RNA polymerase sigma factor (sigma-70 family)
MPRLIPESSSMKDSSAPVDLAAAELSRQDAELVVRCRRGDHAAWDELIDRFQRLIYAIPRRAGLDAEQCDDVFQDVWATLFEKLDEIKQPEKIRSWIVTTAKFKTWAVIRGSRNIRMPDTAEEMEDEMAAIPDRAPLADEQLIELEQQHLIRTAIARIDERCQKILSMIYLRARAASYAEVAIVIGVAETSISPLRTRCLKKLEKLLSK